MATATLLRSLRQQRDISSAPLSAFESLSGAKTKVSGTCLSYGIGVISRRFCWRPRAIENESIGINFGPTSSFVLVRAGQRAKPINNAEGSFVTPSVVAFNHKGEVTVGTRAKHQAFTEPKNTVFGVNRLIGRKFDEIETQKAKRRVPYNIVKAPNGDALIEVHGQMYSPTQIAAFVIADLKKTAEVYLGKTVHEANISVPGCFNEAQRKAIEDAGRIAGLDVHRISDRSENTAITYLSQIGDGLITVFDLGGGTFDFSIFKIVVSDGFVAFEVKAKIGDSSLGGEDFDDAMVDFMISKFKRTDGICLKDDRFALQRLREAAEKAKIDLSTNTKTKIDLPFITRDESGAKHLNITVTRSEFEAQVNHLVERIKSLCKKCIRDSEVSASELDRVLLVGGMCRVPIVLQLVTEISGVPRPK